MKLFIPLCLFSILTSLGLARTWTSASGKTVEGEFVSATDSKVSIKRDKDGKTFTLPLSKLSKADREFVAQQKASGNSNGSSPAPITGPYAHLVTGEWVLQTHGKLPYAFYGPKDLAGKTKLPLVITLHGKSQNNTNGNQTGLGKSFIQGVNASERPCLVLSPLCYQPHGGTGGGWDKDPGKETLELIKLLVRKSSFIDTDRIYVVGVSMGGGGTWHFLKEEPRLFAAGIPICGWIHGAGKLRSMPIWAFHGAKDTIVTPDSVRTAAKDLKRSKVFKYTEFPEAGHGITHKVTGDVKVHEWLFSQSRGKKKK